VPRCSPISVRQLELWGGIECTVNRVHARFFDQIDRSGHSHRSTDLERLASIGIRTLRYPVLWERTSNAQVERFAWYWPDERLAKIQALGISPIVGLVHHGSGPAGTSLVERSFSTGLERYARAVAQRYPWVRDYTPVNEPLTTARFAGLYGHWYPHGTDALTFARAFLEQCRGIVLAMRAIREIRSDARLIQTEDLGKTHSTPLLNYQAEFENERRWLTWDLLCGRVTRGHATWSYLQWAGVPESELMWFAENQCPPDIAGINHYLTSERFLDHRLQTYPPHTIGENGTHRYADVEAVRVAGSDVLGFGRLIDETCERYGLPVAITEVHNGCTREEQIRWFMEGWNAASDAAARGRNVVAVTAWSLLGGYDWDSLVTLDRGHYEPGVFDLRAPAPRPTALAKLIQRLTSGERPDHPVLDAPGWWRRPERLIFGNCGTAQFTPGATDARCLLITGKTGTLGGAFARVCESRGIPYHLVGRNELDIADSGSVEKAIERFRPWAVINAAGYVRVEDAEHDRERCFRENTTGPELLAAACASRGAKFVTFSSDLVFDGEKGSPYVERDPVGPLSVYGESKAEAERLVLSLMSSALVIRTSAFFGPWDEYNFVLRTLRDLSAGNKVFAATHVVSPTYVPDLVNGTLDLLIDGESGIWHVANSGSIRWVDLAKRCAGLAGYSESDIIPINSTRWKPPRNSALASERAAFMPPLEDAIERFLKDCTFPKGAEECATSGGA
jgi:dTDP-4-dehydrorhamnose reductase